MARRTAKASKSAGQDTITAPGAPAVVLNEALDLTSAGELAKSLLARRGTPITIEASKVRHVGGQCAQILVSAAKTWEADGLAFDLVGPSPEFTEGLRLLGLAATLATKEVSQ